MNSGEIKLKEINVRFAQSAEISGRSLMTSHLFVKPLTPSTPVTLKCLLYLGLHNQCNQSMIPLPPACVTSFMNARTSLSLLSCNIMLYRVISYYPIQLVFSVRCHLQYLLCITKSSRTDLLDNNK